MAKDQLLLDYKCLLLLPIHNADHMLFQLHEYHDTDGVAAVLTICNRASWFCLSVIINTINNSIEFIEPLILNKSTMLLVEMDFPTLYYHMIQDHQQ
jgi:hypothetical protein